LEESDKVKISSTSDGVYTLRLSDLTEEDSGQYTIKAVNDAGQTSCTAQLLVHGLYSSRCKRPIWLFLGDLYPELYGTSLAIWDHTVSPATRHR